MDESSESSCEEDDFFIPELPRGKNLTINIQSTWGDRHYVGLNGIEMFAATGEPIKVDKVSPASILTFFNTVVLSSTVVGRVV